MIARKSFLTTIVVFINALLGLVALFFVGKYMGSKTAGMVGFALSFIGLFGIFSDLGFGFAHMKRISEGKDLGKCIGTYTVIRGVLTAVTCMIILGFILISKYIFHYTFYDATTEAIVYIFIGHYIITSISNIMILTFSARIETAKQQIASVAEFAVRAPTTVFIALTFRTAEIGAFYLAFAYLIGVSAVAVFAYTFFKGYPIKKPDKDSFKDYAYFAMPVLLITIITTTGMYLDKVLIGFFLSAEAVACYYYPQYVFVYISAMVISAVGGILFPTFSALFAKKDLKAIRTIVPLAERYLSMIMAPISVFAIIFAEPLINLFFGITFLPGAVVLRLFAIVVFLTCIVEPYRNLLFGMGKVKLLVKYSGFMFPIIICLLFLFIPSHLFGLKTLGLGIAGAALVPIIGRLTANFYIKYMCWKIMRIKIQFKIIYHIFASLVMGLILAYLHIIFVFMRWYELLGMALIGLGIYLVLLVLLNEFTKADWKVVCDTLNLKKLGQYIREELR